MISDLARRTYLSAKRSPAMRKWLKTPFVSRLKTALGSRLMVADPQYERWMTAHLRDRQQQFSAKAEPGLLSFLTPVWNVPIRFLKVLVTSLLNQYHEQPFEWIILDNGSSDEKVTDYLNRISRRDPRIRLFRVEENLGIIGGMRFCLQRATGRYVLPLDHDDCLYRDCVSIFAEYIRKHDYPPLLYSDEDHLLGKNHLLPYFKPRWDPVLFLNSAYIAHLGALDRRLALDLDVYGDGSVEGCPDWDAFLRFMTAGHTPVHVPEIVYSWRQHAGSTAANMHCKSYIHQSHRAVLSRYIQSLQHAHRYTLQLSPLFDGTPDWWIRRRPIDPKSLLSIRVCDSLAADYADTDLGFCDYPRHQTLRVSRHVNLENLIPHIKKAVGNGGLVCFVSEHVEIQNDQWPWEALGLMERLDDVVIVGGRIFDSREMIVDAGRYFGFGRGCGCPDRGRSLHDFGYFAQMRKQRSVSAVSTQFCVFDATFLIDVIRHGCPKWATLPYLGMWAGAYALRNNRRVVYSPFLTGKSDHDWDAWTSDAERKKFRESNHDLFPDTRFYSRLLSLESGAPYIPADPRVTAENSGYPVP